MAVRILILSDGRPGHFNLSEGIAAAAARRRPTEISRLTLRRGWPGGLVSSALSARVSPTKILRWVYGVDAEQVPEADLVVSAGSETLGANVALSRLRGTPNVFYGSLRRFDPTDFALVLTSYATNANRPHHAVTLKPSAFDPASLPALPASGTPQVVGIVVGGDAPGIRFAPADWTALTTVIKDLHHRTGMQAILSNSRRTPDAVSDALAALAGSGDRAVLRFVDVRGPGAPRLSTIFAQAQALLVTADSSSMLSEACWAQRPTLALMPAGARLTADEASYRAWLEAQGWCATCMTSELTAERVLVQWSALRPMRDNPLDALATLLTKHLPGLLGP